MTTIELLIVIQAMKPGVKHIRLYEELLQIFLLLAQVMLDTFEVFPWSIFGTVGTNLLLQAHLDILHTIAAASGLIVVLFSFQYSMLQVINTLLYHLGILYIILY